MKICCLLFLCFSTFSHAFETAYVRFETPPHWRCDLKEKIWECAPPWESGDRITSIALAENIDGSAETSIADLFPHGRSVRQNTFTRPVVAPAGYVPAYLEVKTGEIIWQHEELENDAAFIHIFQTRFQKMGQKLKVIVTLERAKKSRESSALERLISSLNLLGDLPNPKSMQELILSTTGLEMLQNENKEKRERAQILIKKYCEGGSRFNYKCSW